MAITPLTKRFYFVINYTKCNTHVHSDALSRLQTLGETETDVDDDLPCFLTTAPEEHEETHELANADDALSENVSANPDSGSPEPQLVRIN